MSQSLTAQFRGDPDCSDAGFGYAISCTKQQTCFIDQSIADPDGIGLSIVQWEWDFDTDGNIDLTTNISTNPCHIYPFAGSQTVSLYITNDALPPCIDTFRVVIEVNQTPVLYLTKEDISDAVRAYQGRLFDAYFNNNERYTWGAGDSLDRERVRDIILEQPQFTWSC